ncbi:MAG TPA: hypothetical protein DDW21_04820 [Verrucomicrobiales bacterium]|jgi:hypothetical protein|nr:MAG: hypothetical protein B9S37_07365 [Verrucomicrobiae bacterium Tous-C3TDCM]PAZ05877.1 MAG: hypothetical protein CAK88_05990 [Verrucomicrobiae bacterium AMD-G2]HBE22758.1 hypothetical protein [Verrucomicrobiales bacterium]
MMAFVGLLVIGIFPRVIWKPAIASAIGLDEGNAADAVHTALVAVHAEYSGNTNVISVTVFFEDARISYWFSNPKEGSSG